MKYPVILLLTGLAGCATTSPTASQERVELDSHVLLAQMALEQDRPEEATQHFLDASLIAEDPAVAERAARMAHQLGMNEEGLRAIERWRELAPEDERSFWFSGVFHVRAGRLDRAIEDFTHLVEELPDADPGTGLALVAEALEDEPATAAATSVMSALNETFTGTPEGHFSLARLAMRSGDFELALDNARTATELEPDWREAQLLHARALLLAGRTDQSLALAEDLAQRYDGVEMDLEYAELLLSAGRSEQAERLLNEILAENPGMAEATRALAFLELTSDRLDSAEEHFATLRSDPRYRDEAFYYLGRIAETEERYLQATRSYSRVTEGTHAVEAQLRTATILHGQMGNAEGALRHLEEFGNANPRFHSEMLLARGQLLLRMDEAERALALLDDALAENPSDAALQDAHVQLYNILTQDAADSGDFEAAHAWLDEGLERHPGNVSLRYSRALLLQQQDRMRPALGVLEDLVEENPDNAVLLNALGYLLTDYFDRHEEARGYIQRALALQPDSPAIIDSMGWVLFHLEEHEAALDYLERAYRLEDDPEIAAHLVDVYWALGRQEDALTLLDTALEQNPDDAHLREIGERLGR